MAAMDIPPGCVAHALFEKRQYSKLSTSKMSTKRAVRAGVRFGAVTAKWERRCFYLLQSGELMWNEIGSSDLVCNAGSCIVLNAHITSERASIVEEIGDYLDNSSPYYLLVATATRRLTIRTESVSDRDHFMATLKEVAGSKTYADHDTVNQVEDAEMMFALTPMYWHVSSKGTSQMVVSRSSFRSLCQRNPSLADLSIVDVIFDGLVADHTHSNAGLTFDRFLRYVKCLSSRVSESNSAFDAIKLALHLGEDEPLVRAEDLVQSTTPNLLVSNGTLFLTHRYLIHQGWNLDTINVIPLETIKSVGETTSSGMLSISDTLELVGVDVHEITSVDNIDPIRSSEPRHDVKYSLQFSRFKDMILSSGEERDQGGRRGLWMDLLREFSHAYSISNQFADCPSAAMLPDFVAMNLVHSRAVFRSSGHFSKSLLLCTAFVSDNQAAQRIVTSFLERKPNKLVQLTDVKETSVEAFPAVFSTGSEVTTIDAVESIAPSSKEAMDEWRHSALALLIIFLSFSLWSNKGSDPVHRLSAPMVFMCCSLLFLLRVAEKKYQNVLL